MQDTRHLVAVSCPALESMELSPKPEGLTIGRQASCDLLLPAMPNVFPASMHDSLTPQ